MNKRGEKPANLTDDTRNNAPQKPIDLVEQESLTRFDRRKGNNNKKKKKRPQPQDGQKQAKNSNNANRGNKNQQKRNSGGQKTESNEA
jgi:hypothetical protein